MSNETKRSSLIRPISVVSPSPTVKPVKTTSSSITNKKSARPSTGPRLTQVKASIGLPRVRTTSITQPPAPPKEVKTPPNKETSSRTTHLPISRPTHIPLPTTITTTTTTTTTTTSPDQKKSNLKTPNQRGPGSTLRLRSMLAKRGGTNTTKN